jgi:hypothetical protein
MDQFLDWFDANAALVLSPHAWVWASTTAIIAVGCLIAIANVARHYARMNTDFME